MAGWGPIASNLACVALQDSHKKIVETLEVDNEVLNNIHEQFMNVVSSNSIRVHSFQEGKGMSGVKGISGKVYLQCVGPVSSHFANHRACR